MQLDHNNLVPRAYSLEKVLDITGNQAAVTSALKELGRESASNFDRHKANAFLIKMSLAKINE